MELLPCFAIVLIFALPLWLGPKQLEPISRCPDDSPSVRFALIDLAAFVVLLTIMFAFLRWVFHDSPSEFYRQPATFLLFASLSLMLLALWGHSTRCLSAHGVQDWRARVVYLLISPLAYIMPVVGAISLFFLLAFMAGEGNDLAWPFFLVLLCPLSWVICKSASLWVAKKSTVDIHHSGRNSASSDSELNEETFDPFAPKE